MRLKRALSLSLSSLKKDFPHVIAFVWSLKHFLLVAVVYVVETYLKNAALLLEMIHFPNLGSSVVENLRATRIILRLAINTPWTKRGVDVC